MAPAVHVNLGRTSPREAGLPEPPDLALLSPDRIRDQPVGTSVTCRPLSLPLPCSATPQGGMAQTQAVKRFCTCGPCPPLPRVWATLSICQTGASVHSPSEALLGCGDTGHLWDTHLPSHSPPHQHSWLGLICGSVPAVRPRASGACLGWALREELSPLTLTESPEGKKGDHAPRAQPQATARRGT